MNLTRVETGLSGTFLLEVPVFSDARGYFLESYHSEKYSGLGLFEKFVQDNVSYSKKSVLRGLHYQKQHAQGKLVSVLEGEIWDVAVDLRRSSPTFKRWVGVELSSKNRRQLYIGPGFAHGFVVLSDAALVTYKCTDFYSPENEHTVIWDCPDLAIDWPTRKMELSGKDAAGLSLAQLGEAELPE